MSWLALLKAVLSIADYIAKICHDKQLLDAGEYKAIAKGTTDALERIRAANAARANVNSVSVDTDPDNRD